MIVWEDISMERCTDFYKLGNGTLTGIKYWDEILGPIVRPYGNAVGFGFFLLHNKARPCVERVCRQFVEDKGIDITEWTTCCAELNTV